MHPKQIQDHCHHDVLEKKNLVKISGCWWMYSLTTTHSRIQLLHSSATNQPVMSLLHHLELLDDNTGPDDNVDFPKEFRIWNKKTKRKTIFAYRLNFFATQMKTAKRSGSFFKNICFAFYYTYKPKTSKLTWSPRLHWYEADVWYDSEAHDKVDTFYYIYSKTVSYDTFLHTGVTALSP